jgi:uncharacterized membrane protein
MRLLRILALSTLVILAPTAPASATAMFMGLRDLAGGTFHSQAMGVSGDGSVVVGAGYSAPQVFEPFRWTEAGGMVGLGGLPGARSPAAEPISRSSDG